MPAENYTLPVGTNTYVAIYAAHRDPVFWQRPLDFYPEHFTPENTAARPKYSYLPLSMGPRNCPGMYTILYSILLNLY